MARMRPGDYAGMTLDDLAALPGFTVGTAIAAHFFGVDQWYVTLMAREGRLPEGSFFFSGNRLHISKAWLLDFLGYKPGQCTAGNEHGAVAGVMGYKPGQNAAGNERGAVAGLMGFKPEGASA